MPIVIIFAPNIIGIDIRNENLRAVFSFRPERIPAEIVVPERDMPGKIERICENPIIRAFFIFNLLFRILKLRLAIIKTKPVIPKPNATIDKFVYMDSNISLKSRPIIAAGIVAIISRIPSLPSSVWNLNFSKSWKISVISLPK